MLNNILTSQQDDRTLLSGFVRGVDEAGAELMNPLKEKPKGNGGFSHRQNEIPEPPEGVGEVFKKQFPTQYNELNNCKGGKGGDLRKAYTNVVTELKKFDADQNYKNEYADMLQFKDYLKKTCKQ